MGLGVPVTESVAVALPVCERVPICDTLCEIEGLCDCVPIDPLCEGVRVALRDDACDAVSVVVWVALCVPERA